MSSLPVRDPKKDRLLTPENSVLVVIDYQPAQIDSVNSMNRAELVRNILLVARIARNYRPATRQMPSSCRLPSGFLERYLSQVP